MLPDSIQRRILILFLIAVIIPPSLIVVLFVRNPQVLSGSLSFFALLALSFLLSALVVRVGSKYFVLEPLKSLNDAMIEWRTGADFKIQSRFAIPSEIVELSTSMRGATITLQQREHDLREAFARQDLLMQEIHHRVKNNLQIIASLMNLQASRIKLPEARAEFQSARDRVRALATVHRHLYAHGELHSIKMREFLVELCEQLFHAMGETPNDRIELDVSAPDVQISSDQAVPLSLIVTEAVSNAVKYAFPRGRRGSVSVRLVTDDDDAELSIRDDGIGVPAGRVETESGTRDGIGITLIRGFARQLGATLTVEEGDGTRYIVRMKLRRERIESPSLPPIT